MPVIEWIYGGLSWDILMLIPEMNVPTSSGTCQNNFFQIKLFYYFSLQIADEDVTALFRGDIPTPETVHPDFSK